MINKTLHKNKLKIEQDEPYKTNGGDLYWWTSCYSCLKSCDKSWKKQEDGMVTETIRTLTKSNSDRRTFEVMSST